MNEIDNQKLEEMKDSITKLQSEFEELTKRISSIFESHTTTTQLTSVKEYFNSVQIYLQNLLNSFDTHIDNCITYSTQISQLQNEIFTINSTLETLESLKNLDATEIESLITKFNSFMGENTTTLDNIINDISSLQTDIGAMQDEIDSINEDISSINTDIGSMQTTITNLTATQNSLSSAQNSMSANISTLESRVSTNETNISDHETRLATAETTIESNSTTVSEYEDRIATLENNFSIPFNTCNKRDLVMHLNCLTNPIMSRKYYFRATPTGITEQNFTLHYLSSGIGTLTINLYENDVLENTFTVDLAMHATSFSFTQFFEPTDVYQNFQFEVSSTSQVIFSNVYCYFKGINIQFFEYDRQLKFKTMNKYVCITKYDGTKVKFGMISNLDFDVNTMELPYEIDDSGDELKIRYATFCMRAVMAENTVSNMVPVLYVEKSDGLYYAYDFDVNLKTFTLYNTYNFDFCGEITSSYHEHPQMAVIRSDNKAVIRTCKDLNTTVDNENSFMNAFVGRWLQFRISDNINMKIGGIGEYRPPCSALNEDGYIYYLVDRTYPPKKVMKGEIFVSTIIYSGGAGCTYIVGNKKVTRIDKNLKITHVIENCSYVHEILPNSLLKRTFIKETPNGLVQETVDL